MQQPFKIRKNKSQKDIPLCSDHSKKSPNLALHKISKSKASNHLISCKSNHLQPLVKTKGSIYNPIQHTTDIKLDNTQPVPHKSFSLNKYDSKNDGFHLIPLDLNNNQKSNQSDKENRSTSMNEVKCPAITKVKSNLLRTDKMENFKVYAQRGEELIKNRHEKQNIYDMKKKQGYKTTKINLYKTSSKTKLSKICGKTSMNDVPVLYNSQVQTEPDLNNYKSFRKGIIYKMLNQPKSSNNNTQGLNMIEQQGQIESKEIKMNEIKERQELKSPALKKDNSLLFQANCSTIKEQEESCSSFISKGIYQQLIMKNMNEPSPFVEHKLCNDRRIKMQTDRIKKKKFPQNFFK